MIYVISGFIPLSAAQVSRVYLKANISKVLCSKYNSSITFLYIYFL